LRDELITRAVDRLLEAIEPERIERGQLDPAEAAERLSRFLGGAVRRALAAVPEDERPTRQAQVVNEMLALAGESESLLRLPPELLLGIAATPERLGPPHLPPRPEIPLSVSDLLFNGRGQPSIGGELQRELASAKSVDLLCAFVLWSGVRIVLNPLRDLVARGGRLRIITTTYMGATQPRALDALIALGADVRVAYDARITKLHAKAWLLEREAGLTTAFIGSSNLSRSALHDGLEWNVRL
jgi:hypothetical protein